MNWKGFLRDSDNKTELFHFLAEKIATTRTTNHHSSIVTRGEDALVNQEMALDDISPCSHEEADTRIFVHAKSVVLHGSKSLIRGGSRGYRAYLLIRSDFSDIVYGYVIVYIYNV